MMYLVPFSSNFFIIINAKEECMIKKIANYIRIIAGIMLLILSVYCSMNRMISLGLSDAIIAVVLLIGGHQKNDS